jgi:hypothetical protein
MPLAIWYLLSQIVQNKLRAEHYMLLASKSGGGPETGMTQIKCSIRSLLAAQSKKPNPT